MLEPDSRITYMELLRPPYGYQLVKAVGTTFSAELDALLFAPLALCSKDTFCDSHGNPNPSALLSSLRQTARKMVIFCQRGRIHLPRASSGLNVFLNNTICEVNFPNANASFHPKVWLMHFATPEDHHIYRLVCMSRNATFDSSWDAAVVLEGEKTEEIVTDNWSLSRYLTWLSLRGAVKALPGKSEMIKMLAKEIRHVNFKDIYPANDIAFDFSAPGKELLLDWAIKAQRLMVISPFLDDNGAQLDIFARLVKGPDKPILVSRRAALDELPDECLSRWQPFQWNDTLESMAAIEYEEKEGAEEEAEEDRLEEEQTVRRRVPVLRGLHAKVFVAEEDTKAVLVIGSANATRAAFSGRNVEFVIRLEGKRQHVGIDQLLGKDDDGKEQLGLRALIEPYFRQEDLPPKDEEYEKLRNDIDKARGFLAACSLILNIMPGEESRQFNLTVSLSTAKASGVYPETVKGIFWPASVEPTSVGNIRQLMDGEEVEFPGLSASAISKFVAFKLEAPRKNTPWPSSGFVLGGKLLGIPSNLEEMALTATVTRQGFFEYLWFLLLQDSAESLPFMGFGGDRGSGSAGKPFIDGRPPLFEDLLVRCVEDRSLIAEIDEVVKAFESGSPESAPPSEFLEVWTVIREGLHGSTS